MTTMSTPTITSAPPAGGLSLDHYVPLLGAEIDELRALARPLTGSSVLMVNSTAVGGGVAELLNRIVPIMQELGLAARWDLITGGQDFYEVTKAFHNALHGAPFPAGTAAFEIFRSYSAANRARLRLDAEFAVMHDPQPAAMIEARPDRSGHWIWRCHIDLSHPHPDVWGFLEPWVARYDAAIFSSPSFARQLPIPQYLFYPSIDPLSDKNRPLEPEFVRSVTDRYGIDLTRPVLVQISRFDRLKDPVGVIRAFRIVKRYHDSQLVLAGGSADDDPEGAAVLEETRQAADGDPDIHIIELPPAAPLEVNALQTAATIVIQKSLREGFGLTVAEAMWKKKPVVASSVGGIPTQVIHKHTGLLAHSVEGTAYQIRYLLSHPEIAERLGERAHEHVREQFLVTGNVKRYLSLFLHLRKGNG
jgi:trehalose synthase